MTPEAQDGLTAEDPGTDPEIATAGQAGAQIPSTDDARTVNNTMRHTYRTLTEEEKQQMSTIKDLGLEFIETLDEIGDSREISIAKTKMEEAVMWGTKHVTR